jgi:hypothetical protein
VNGADHRSASAASSAQEALLGEPGHESAGVEDLAHHLRQRCGSQPGAGGDVLAPALGEIDARGVPVGERRPGSGDREGGEAEVDAVAKEQGVELLGHQGLHT